MVAIMSLLDWFDPNFLRQFRFFRPHKVNGRWYFIKRDIVLPFNNWPVMENRLENMIRRPPVMALPLQFFMRSTLFRRMSQAHLDLVWARTTIRGSSLMDYAGEQKRKIRFTLIGKNRDPYLHMLMGVRNLRARWCRAWGWQVPPRHGPGAGLGFVPKNLDYYNKVARMIEDDYCDTGISVFALRMFPITTMRKYFNELPRPTSYWYGMDYTREQMFNHIAWGIDPGTVAAEAAEQNPNPDLLEARKKEKEYVDYLFPELAVVNSPDYKLKWPMPDDNVFRPTYNRGFNRKYWSRNPY